MSKLRDAARRALDAFGVLEKYFDREPALHERSVPERNAMLFAARDLDAALADQAQAEPDRRLQLAMQNAERWKAHALELSARLQQYEPGAGMALNAATQPAAQPVAAPDERKAFESWARIRGFRAERTMPADAAYNDSGSQIMWESWQARAMLAAAPKVQP